MLLNRVMETLSGLIAMPVLDVALLKLGRAKEVHPDFGARHLIAAAS